MEQKPKAIQETREYLKDFESYWQEYRAHQDEFPNKPFLLYEEWKLKRANAHKQKV